jgi:ABC-type phosphate transport system permease subunit
MTGVVLALAGALAEVWPLLGLVRLYLRGRSRRWGR